ncbi:MAG: helix-turn-helix domain-containing protein, partial [Thiogranum sp.]
GRLEVLSKFRKNYCIETSQNQGQRLAVTHYFRQSFNDVSAMCEAVRAWDVEFYPMAKLQNGGSGGAFVQTFGRGFEYGYAKFTPGLHMFGAPPTGLITFNVMEPATRHYWLRGHDLDDGMAWVFPAGAELRSMSPPGFQSHSLSVSEERVEQVAAALEINVPLPSKRVEVFSVQPEVLALVRQHMRALRGGGSGAFPFDPVREVLRLLVPRWLAPDSYGNPIRARDVAVSKCLELIEDHDIGRLPIDTLLDECNMSERTLLYAFRERFGVTPAALIKSRRLAKARSMLRHADSEKATVGDIAALFGFWHLGQFAVDYRKTFGERPSETLKGLPRIK